jgi:hypothetical protein
VFWFASHNPQSSRKAEHVGQALSSMAYSITGRGTMTGWVVVGLGGVEGDGQLKDWIQRAMEFVGTLPAR